MLGGLGYLNKLGASGGLVFSPGQLFSGGEQGAWYDPSDNSTMFQDAAGTTPVTAVEQAVGLILDKSKGLVIGTNIVTNPGPFTATTDWTGQNSATLSVASAKLRVSGNGVTAFPFASTPFTTIVGRGYVINANLAFVSGVNDSVYIQKSDAAASVVNGVTSITAPATSKTLFFVATATTTYLQLVADDATDVYDWDNISVKELPGNHAFQSTLASRPTLRARYNQLTYSEQFDNAAWTKTALNGAISANATTAPDGTLTADLYTENSALAQRAILQTVAVLPGTHTQYVSVKNNGRRYVSLYPQGVGTAWAIFDLQTGVVSATGGANIAGSSITAQANGFYRCSVSVTVAAAGNLLPHVYLTNSNSSPAAGYTGDGVSGVFIWGADLRRSNDTNIPYQRIAAATDYATGPEFPQYLAFDGTDDSLLTSSVDFATVTSDGQARRNLLLVPTLLDAASWIKGNNGVGLVPVVTANAGTAPDGTTTADRIQFDCGDVSSVTNRSRVQQGITVISGQGYFGTIWLKAYDSGNVGKTVRLVVESLSSVIIHTLTADWAQVSLPGTSSSTSLNFLFETRGTLTTQTADVLVWGAQLETGSTATAFQNIGTDKMTVFAGLSRLGTADAMVVELSADAGANNGTFYFGAPLASGSWQYAFLSRGTSNGVATVTSGFSPPVTNVLTLQGDISGDASTIQANGTQVGSATTDQGTGNYGNYPLYIGRRNNATLPLNGRIYSLIVRGAASNTTQVAQTEKWVANKTPLGTV